MVRSESKRSPISVAPFARQMSLTTTTPISLAMSAQPFAPNPNLTFLAMSNVSQKHHLWLTYSQENTSEMFINIPFIFAGSKIVQLRKYFESPCGLL